MHAGVIQPTEDLNKKKGKEQKKFALLAGAETFIFSWPQTLVLLFSGLQPQAELHHRLCWVSSLQTAEHRTSQPP